MSRRFIRGHIGEIRNGNRRNVRDNNVVQHRRGRTSDTHSSASGKNFTVRITSPRGCHIHEGDRPDKGGPPLSLICWS